METKQMCLWPCRCITVLVQQGERNNAEYRWQNVSSRSNSILLASLGNLPDGGTQGGTLIVSWEKDRVTRFPGIKTGTLCA